MHACTERGRDEKATYRHGYMCTANSKSQRRMGRRQTISELAQTLDATKHLWIIVKHRTKTVHREKPHTLTPLTLTTLFVFPQHVFVFDHQAFVVGGDTCINEGLAIRWHWICTHIYIYIYIYMYTYMYAYTYPLRNTYSGRNHVESNSLVMRRADSLMVPPPQPLT